MGPGILAFGGALWIGALRLDIGNVLPPRRVGVLWWCLGRHLRLGLPRRRGRRRRQTTSFAGHSATAPPTGAPERAISDGSRARAPTSARSAALQRGAVAAAKMGVPGRKAPVSASAKAHSWGREAASCRRLGSLLGAIVSLSRVTPTGLCGSSWQPEDGLLGRVRRKHSAK